MICSADMCCIYVINVSVCANYFSSGFICGAGCPVGSYFRGSGCSSVETPRFSVIRSHTKVSLGLKHFVLEGVM